MPVTRRGLLGLVTVGSGPGGIAFAQSTPPAGEQAEGARNLGNRNGAPRGRVGAATRDARYAGGMLSLEPVAPRWGVGLTAQDQPSLFFVLAGGSVPSWRFTLVRPRQARPVAQLGFSRPQSPGLVAIHLRDHGVRLEPGVTHIWSVTLATDPSDPSREMVASAAIEYQPLDAMRHAAWRSAGQEPAALARAGFWYDAVALAERNRSADGGHALAGLLAALELRL